MTNFSITGVARLSEQANQFEEEDRVKREAERIQATLKELIEDAELRQSLARASYNRSKDFDWKICSEETFKFLRHCASRFQLKECVEF